MRLTIAYPREGELLPRCPVQTQFLQALRALSNHGVGVQLAL